MRTPGEIQYVYDTLLIQELLDGDIVKSADASGILSTIMSSVKDEIGKLVDTSSTSAFIESVFKIMEPAIMFRINPIFGIMDVAAQSFFHFSITDIFRKIIGAIRSKIEGGTQVSPEEVNQAGIDAAGGLEASSNLLYGLHLMKQASIMDDFKSLVSDNRYRKPTGGSMLFPAKRTGLMNRMFGFLGARGLKSMIIGFVVWLIKTLLGGLGLLAVGGLAASFFMGKKTPAEQAQQTTPGQTAPGQTTPEQTSTPAIAVPSSPPPVGMKASGYGEADHSNDAIWIVPIYGDVRNTIISWAVRVYPALEGHENEIASSASFNRIANTLEDLVNPQNPEYLSMPSNIHSIKQMVDSFAGDVAARIKGTNGQD